MKKMGRCHVCGLFRKLTFEHYPPQGTGLNPESLFTYDGQDFLRQTQGLRPYGHKSPRGFGGHTLCSDCNSKTGDWYAREFIEWARAIHRFVTSIPEGIRFIEILPRVVFPLRFLKHCMVIILSHIDPSFCDDHESLRRLVLNRDNREFPDDYGLWLAATTGPTCGTMGLTGCLTTFGRTAFSAEFAYPPFIILFIERKIDCRPFFNLLQFLRFGFYEDTSYNLLLPVYHKDVLYPGIYRERRILSPPSTLTGL